MNRLKSQWARIGMVSKGNFGRQWRTFANSTKPPDKSYNQETLVRSLIFTAGLLVGGYFYLSEITPNTLSTLKLEQLTSPLYANETQLKKAIEEVRTVFSAGDIEGQGVDTFVKSTDEEISSHADTYFNSYHPETNEKPYYVIYPRLTEEVSQIMKILHTYRVPVVPISGKSSLEGHFVHTRQGVCLDLSLMDQILEVNATDLDARVQAGIGWETLADYLEDYNLLFPIDPGPGATIGGICANNASGTNATRYGECYKNILSLTVVLADGTVIKTKNRPRKSSAGYNLNSLFIGSEGTLGIITEATLRLYVEPKFESVAVIPFNTIEDAANAVNDYILHGTPLNAIELLDDKMMQCVNLSGETTRKWKESPTLFLKIGGLSSEMVHSIVDQVKNISKRHNYLEFSFARDKEETIELWSARKVALWSTINQGKEKNPSTQLWTTDAAVPISKLPQFLVETKADIDNHNLQNTLVSHIGDGNAHSFILYQPEQFDIAEKVVDNMVRRAISYEGTCTGEHGVGLGKRQFLIEELGQKPLDVMRSIKLALDPFRILNPDKVFQIDPLEKKRRH